MTLREAPRDDLVELIHGHRVSDPYRWLEDPGSTATRAWSDRQRALTDAYFDGCAVRQAALVRLAELDHVTADSPPTRSGGRIFVARRPSGDGTRSIYVQEPDGAERLLVDASRLGGEASLTRWHPSPGGRFLAYQVVSGSGERAVLHVVDVATGSPVDRPIDRLWYASVAWLPDGSGFYYVRCRPSPGAGLHRRLHLHFLGSDPDRDDIEVFGGDLPAGAGLTVDLNLGRWLVVHTTTGVGGATDVWLADLDQGRFDSPPLAAVVRGVDARTVARVSPEGVLYLLTTYQAPRGRLCRADPRAPDVTNWRDVLEEDPQATLVTVAFADGALPELLAVHMRHGRHEVSVHDRVRGRRLRTLELPGIGSVSNVTEPREGGSTIWLGYTDYLTPSSRLRYQAGDRVLRGRRPAIEQSQKVCSRHITYESTDGTAVPMFLITPSEAPDHPRPTLLTGYGGFGQSMLPSYQPETMAWVEAGGVVAIACLRGGGEEGEAWHRAGMRERKQNTFDDFHAAAEWLIAHGYTTPRQLGIMGASNAGLLVGAALTQRPELYGAAVCVASLFDMVRYHLFGLGPAWRAEYGSADDPADLPHLLAYSPYHRVTDGVDYPPTLLIAGDEDRRVDPMHARKMCAALQHADPSRRVLFRMAEGVGHLGGSAVAAETLAFLARETGLAELSGFDGPDRSRPIVGSASRR
ncbi:prolyl oligopeptidase family protein [Streptosporangium sp. NPDC000396]|uniref:prolyl oligopeptidase family serine peptidase n=1 Tax=Streptosporangium sp. NPDC000396 TaxID=3366185 RepID=UPI003694CB42